MEQQDPAEPGGPSIETQLLGKIYSKLTRALPVHMHLSTSSSPASLAPRAAAGTSRTAGTLRTRPATSYSASTPSHHSLRRRRGPRVQLRRSSQPRDERPGPTSARRSRSSTTRDRETILAGPREVVRTPGSPPARPARAPHGPQRGYSTVLTSSAFQGSTAPWRRVDYPDGTPGLLIVLKPTLTGDEPADLIEYHSSHPAFPQEPTSQQFFDEANGRATGS